jgi:hypothetical protein
MLRGRKALIFVFNLMSKGSYIQYRIRKYVVLKSDRALVCVSVESGAAATRTGGNRRGSAVYRQAPAITASMRTEATNTLALNLQQSDC